VIQEWRETQLNELIDIKHGFAFKGEYFTDDPTNDLLLTPGNFSVGGGFQWGKYKFYDGPIPTEYILTEGDLVVSMTDLSKAGDTLGYSAMVPPSEYLLLHNQRIGKVIKKSEFIDALYLNYQLRTKTYRNEVLASATGSTVRHTSPTKIGAYRFLLPPLDEQKAIASVLSALDDKIENNRRMNETLEEMARAFFKSWFVDFDPVHAKAAGNAPAHMDAETAALFPSSFGDDGLPVGWSEGAMSETVMLIGGGTPKTKEASYWGGDINWFSVVDAPSTSDVWVIDTQKKITKLGLDNSSAKLLPPKTTIISARGTVGKTALTLSEISMNQSCYGVVGTAGYSSFYTYFSVRKMVAELQANAHGSVFDTITTDTFSSVTVTKPPTEVSIQFDKLVETMLSKISNNLREKQTLAELRDTLLPKLMSGEIRVADAEGEVGGAL
jgi:type I restriction enzyme S subunit